MRYDVVVVAHGKAYHSNQFQYRLHGHPTPDSAERWAMVLRAQHGLEVTVVPED